MGEIIRKIVHSTWPELVAFLKTNETEQYIYRGQANYFKIENTKGQPKYIIPSLIKYNVKPVHWPLISSFDRYYMDGPFYNFQDFLLQQLGDEIFKLQYGDYKFEDIKYLCECSLLERIYYLQHYGVPTCFMDFSRNPLISLYFALNTVRASNSWAFDEKGHKYLYDPCLFISVYALNYKRIAELLKVQFIENDFVGATYGKHKIHNCHLSFDISPENNCESDTLNENMGLQEGCFVLFDNNASDKTLDQFIEAELNGEYISEPLIIEHRLSYNEIFNDGISGQSKYLSLIKYLEKEGISGRNLFNDIQGLKYDLNFFHLL